MSAAPDPTIVLDEATLDRLADAVACEIYEEGCIIYYGGDVGMTYWCDLANAAKADYRARAKELILGAFKAASEERS